MHNSWFNSIINCERNFQIKLKLEQIQTKMFKQLDSWPKLQFHIDSYDF